jgi:hypothetical protein
VTEAFLSSKDRCKTFQREGCRGKTVTSGDRRGGYFLGFEPPKKFVRSSSSPARFIVPRVFSTVTGTSNYKRRNDMSIIKKAPGIMIREVKLEEPVDALLEDYARFIDSNADHVINAVLKRVLWRDHDYRKWRGERRNGQPAAGGNDQPTEAQPRT